MRTKLSLTALATVTALMLSGCYKNDMTAQITKDDKVSGTFVFALSNAGLKMMMDMDPNGDGTIDEKDEGYTGPKPTLREYTDKMFTTEEVLEDAPAGVTAERWYGKGYTGMKVTIAKMPFAKFNRMFASDDGPAQVKLARTKAGQISYRQVVEPAEAMPGLPAPTYRVQLSFPGKVLTTNGKVSGKTVTWSGKATATERVLTATSN